MYLSCISISIDTLNSFQRKIEPIIAVYESRANPADHIKIKGIHGTMSI